MLQVKNEYNKLTKVLMASVDTFHLHEPINSTQEYFYKNDPPVLSKMIAEQNAFAETLVRHGVEVVWADRRDDCTNQVNTRDVAFVVGNESRGIREEILEQCDKIVYIPVPGPTRSLNVSHAAAVALFEWQRQMIVRI